MPGDIQLELPVETLRGASGGMFMRNVTSKSRRRLLCFGKEVAMWKPIVQLLGVLMMTVSTTGPARAQHVPFHEFSMGDVNVRVISLVQKDLNASILRPATEAERNEVARAYPDGAVHNVLNVLLLCGNGVTALVDTGYDWTIEALDAALAQAELAKEDVTHVVVTHAHGDHVGGLVRNGAAAFPRATVLFSERELAAWSDAEAAKSASDGMRRIFESVEDIRRAYGERVRTFVPGTAFIPALPGVQAVDEAGHTPGHVGIMVSAEGQTFLFWSDLLHAFDAQQSMPSISASFDMEPEAAAHVREDMLRRARAEGWLVAGSHVPFTEPRLLK